MGSSIGFPNKVRRYVRIFPLMALFDTFLLYSELFSNKMERKISVRASARSVFFKRLRAAIPDADDMVEVEDAEDGVPTALVIQWLKAIIVFIGLDIRVRFVTNALVVHARLSCHRDASV